MVLLRKEEVQIPLKTRLMKLTPFLTIDKLANYILEGQVE
jgi:hypothetical protein